MIINSMSETCSYPGFCKLATADDNVFSTFRSHPEYTVVLEHTTYQQGLDYLNIIKRDNPKLIEYLGKFSENDIIGSPKTYNYEGKYLLAPGTTRYIKVLSDLIKLFGNLDGFKIAEIGAGYGGQCRVIKDYFNIKDYHIIDMPEVNGLIKKYLNKANIENVRLSSIDDLVKEDYDLVISNYAYSELNRVLQNKYKQLIVDCSNMGYMTLNSIIGRKFDTYTRVELLNLKVNAKTIAEEPLTAPTNTILYWK